MGVGHYGQLLLLFLLYVSGGCQQLMAGQAKDTNTVDQGAP
jgi:hypothetical protein